MHRIKTFATMIAVVFGIMGSPMAAGAAPLLTITIGLYFQTPFSPNYFDPAYGYVLPGADNLNGVTTQVDPKSPYYFDFEYDDGVNNDFVTGGFFQGGPIGSISIADNGLQSAYDFYVVFKANYDVFRSSALELNEFNGELAVVGGGKTAVFYAPAIDHASTRNASFSFVLLPQSTSSALSRSASAAAVPEPRGWMMAIVGFAIVGWAMRRRSYASVANL